MRKKCVIAILSIFVVFVLTMIFINHNQLKSFSLEEQKFIDFTEDIFISEMSSSGFNLQFYLDNPEAFGITKTTNEFGHINYQSMIKGTDVYMKYVSTMEKFDVSSFSPKAKLTYDIFLHYLRGELDYSDYCLFYEPLGSTLGIQAQLPVLLSQYSFDSISDITSYLETLSTLPSYYAEIIEFEKIKAEHGTFMSSESMEEILSQCQSFIQSGYNVLIESFMERMEGITLSASDQKKYQTLNAHIVANKVIPAYEFLYENLSLLKPYCGDHLGLCNIENGKNFYTYLVRQMTGSSKTVPQIEKMINNVMRMELKNMLVISHEQDLNEINLNNTIVAGDNTPTDYLKDLTQKISSDFPSATSLKYQVNTVPDSLSPYLSPAFYISPPIDNFNSNTIFINNYNPITNTELYTTLAHEGYPGHLYQTTYFYSTNPPLIRHLMEFGGYTEGWATYAELFSYRYLFDKNIASYMASSASYSLGAYCVADIGIHYHGWNLAETTSYLTSLGFTDTAAIEEIYNILISEPANYLKYYVGYLEIQELKNYMKHLYKDNYSDYDFHKLMLDVGPAPFEIIKDYMITQFNSSRQ